MITTKNGIILKITPKNTHYKTKTINFVLVLLFKLILIIKKIKFSVLNGDCAAVIAIFGSADIFIRHAHRQKAENYARSKNKRNVKFS